MISNGLIFCILATIVWVFVMIWFNNKTPDTHKLGNNVYTLFTSIFSLIVIWGLYGTVVIGDFSNHPAIITSSDSENSVFYEIKYDEGVITEVLPKSDIKNPGLIQLTHVIVVVKKNMYGATTQKYVLSEDGELLFR